MSKTQLPHRQMVKSHVSETWSVLVRVQTFLKAPINVVTVKHDNCPEIFRITGQIAPFFLVKRGTFTCCNLQNFLYF